MVSKFKFFLSTFLNDTGSLQERDPATDLLAGFSHYYSLRALSSLYTNWPSILTTPYLAVIKVLVWFVQWKFRMTWDPNFKSRLLRCCLFFPLSIFYLKKKIFPCIPRDEFFTGSYICWWRTYSYNSTQTRLSWTWGNVSRHTFI